MFGEIGIGEICCWNQIGRINYFINSIGKVNCVFGGEKVKF